MSQANVDRKTTYFPENNDQRTVIALQSRVFEDVCRYLEKKCGPQMKYYVALRTTAPAAKRGTLLGRPLRQPCNLAEEKDLPNGYWADVLVLPVVPQSSQGQRYGKALVLPILTVNRGMWGIGSRTVYEHKECYDKLERFTSLPTRLSSVDETSLLHHGCSKLCVIGKELPCACG